MKNTDIKSNQELVPEQRSTGRRRFLGAGTAVAPVILTMFSQPALGVTCFTPSRSLSKNTSLSQNDFIGECNGAESPGNYMVQSEPVNTPGKKAKSNPAYNWPIDPETAFHPTFAWGSILNQTKFVEEDGITSLSMLEVLNINSSDGDSGQVAFHLIGAYLNVLNGWVDPKAMTAAGVTAIWQEYVTKGFFEPTAGVHWYAKEIVDYLLMNNIVK